MPPTLQQRVPGASFFFTVRLREAGSTLLTDHIASFGAALRAVRRRAPFHVDAWVVLPDHLHAMWTLPPGDVDYPQRWTAIKRAFSAALDAAGVTATLGSGTIWARRYRDLQVADMEEFAILVDYIHQNPLRHGYCAKAVDWHWSSLHRHLASGRAPPAHGAR
ncbi:MAG: transposase [Pseudomonadota bacterium]